MKNDLVMPLPAARIAPRPPWGRIAIVVLLAALPLFAGSDFHVHLAVMICLNLVFVSGLALICRTGQLSLGHGAFIAIGAYAGVLAGTRLGLPFWLELVAAMVGSAVVALALGWVILRLRGVYFVLVTFAFAELVRLVLLDADALTGGANGIASIPAATLFGFTFDSKLRFYALALAVAALCLLFVWRLCTTPTGHAFDAVAENPALAEASGLDVHRLQVKAFVIGSAMAGLGGVLSAHYTGFVSPESFNTDLSLGVIVMLVIGGRRSLWGPFIGALILTPLPELLRGAVQTQHIFYGAALILALHFMPDGLASLPARLRRKETA